MQRKVVNIGRKAIAFALAFTMVAQPVAGMPFSSKVVANAEELPQAEIPYINFEQIDQSDYTDGVDVAVKYEGTKATISGTDWGGDWVDASMWQIQLKELVPVTSGEKYEISFQITSAVTRDIFLKLGDLNNAETVFYNGAISLIANQAKTVTVDTTSEVTVDQLMILFALGLQDSSNIENTITISNFTVKGERSGYVTTVPVSTEKGKEYDFSATEENAEKDCSDPGRNKDGYDLIWADEFDGNYGNATVDPQTGLNLNNWAYQLGDGSTDCGNPGWGNKELQCYTGDAKNVKVNEDFNSDGVGDGLLRITASYEANGYEYADESTKQYTSARIRTTDGTEALFNTTYGYVEARMSLPGTKGAWPAFWMLPQSTEIYGGWPVSGEIDIMETCGAFSDGAIDKACGTLHWGAPEHVYDGSGYKTLGSDFSYFHTYAIDWEPGKITWYYDGVAINTMTDWTSGFSGASDTLSFDAPFDQPFYILLNLAVDSGQFGGGVNKAVFQDDINMYVDYVRVYQKTDGYAEEVVRSASGNAQDDWKNYEGQNQIADIKTDNIISDVANGDVSGIETSGDGADASKWYLAYQADATDATAESYTGSDGKIWAKVSVNTKGSQDYSVQLIGHYDAKAGYLYRVSFDAYADGDIVGKTVNCDSKAWGLWTTYGIQSFVLADTSTGYSYYVNQQKNFEDCRIEFNLGAQASGNVYIGNVRVEIVDPELINQESDRVAMSDGNIIYNSSFDQGINHTGYWTAGEGTELKVPRYTTEKLADEDISVVDVASKTNYEQIPNGVKYYERRAQVSATENTVPVVYQTDLDMKADSYVLNFEMYSQADTTVTASINTVNDSNESNTLGSPLLSTTTSYKAVDGLKKYEWKFTTTEKLENVAFVLSFGTGATVQIDNVTLIGESQAEKIDANPITPETIWSADDGSGNALPLTNENGVFTLSNITSGGTWYSPQIGSDVFSLANGREYTLSFKYKLNGNTNNTLEYIVQESGGSWTVFVNTTKITYDPAQADADGFCTYTTKFTPNISLGNVHVNFGLGNSGAIGDAEFSFKDARLYLATEETNEPGEENSSESNSGTSSGNVSGNAPIIKHNPDGSITETKSSSITNTAGKEVIVTIVTEKDAQGNVTGITETSVIDKVIKGASATIVVAKDADGNIINAKAEVTKMGANGKSGVTATLYGSVVSQIREASGTTNVTISMIVTAGERKYTVTAESKDLTNGNKLKVMALDPKTGKYNLVNTKTYTVGKDGNVKVNLPDGKNYRLMTIKEAEAIEKAILKTVKVKKTSVTVKVGKSTSIQLSSKLNMDNVSKITYTSGKKSVATVSQNGKVTAKKEGTVTVKAKVTLKNGKTKTVTMKIKIKG